MEESKWNEFEKEYKNHLLTLNLFFIFLLFFFPHTFPPYFFSLKFSITKHDLRESFEWNF